MLPELPQPPVEIDPAYEEEIENWIAMMRELSGVFPAWTAWADELEEKEEEHEQK